METRMEARKIEGNDGERDFFTIHPGKQPGRFTQLRDPPSTRASRFEDSEGRGML